MAIKVRTPTRTEKDLDKACPKPDDARSLPGQVEGFARRPVRKPTQET